MILLIQIKSSQNEVTDDGGSDRKKKEPHFLNLNEDPMLSNVISHFIAPGESLIGRKAPDGSSPGICLSGLSIQQKHAIVTLNKGEVEIKPGSPGAKTKVNGMALTGPLALGHLDRVVFGMFHIFLNIILSYLYATKYANDL